MTYASQKTDLVYNMTKAMVDSFDLYKASGAGQQRLGGRPAEFRLGDSVSRRCDQVLEGSRPVEAEHQAHNDMLIKRRKVLATAWAGMNKQSGADDKAFARRG